MTRYVLRGFCYPFLLALFFAIAMVSEAQSSKEIAGGTSQSESAAAKDEVWLKQRLNQMRTENKKEADSLRYFLQREEYDSLQCFYASLDAATQREYGNFLSAIHSNNYKIIECSSCDGSGRITCSRCKGEGRQTCKDCHGRGVAGVGYNCLTCHGLGTTACSACYGRGVTTCTECTGFGYTVQTHL